MKQARDQAPGDTFENLRHTATSLLEVQQWFTRNPEVLLGNLKLPPDAQLNIELGAVDTTLVKNAVDSGVVDIILKCEFFYPLEPSEDVVHALFDGNHAEVQNFTSRRVFEMRLDQWPLAATMVLEKYMAQGLHMSNIDLDQHAGKYIDSHINLHFHGWSINKIEALLGAGLVASDRMGYPEKGAISKMLFSGRKKIDTSLPKDFSMDVAS